MLIRTLLTVDSQPLRRRMLRLLPSDLVELVPASGGRLLELIHRRDVDLVLASRRRLPEPAEATLRSLRGLPGRPEVIVLSDHEDPEERARLLAAGCVAVIHHPLPDEALRSTFQTLLGRLHEELTRRVHDAPERRASLADFIGDSAAMRAFLDVARRVVDSDSSVLVLGETGVGKERLARALHAEGPRSQEPFVAVNCGALSEGLLESELFGHEEGAFTGATRARRGYFELAHRGTLFLDEVGEMPAHLQVKLLRALQDRQIFRLGGERPVAVDVRVIAATNRQLEAEVAAKRFRPDLYYRLAVVTLTVPPLRERREDIPVLVADYLRHFRTHLNRPTTDVSPDALDALYAYDWPGNVRELINVLERAVLLGGDAVVGIEDLPPAIARLGADASSSATPVGGLLPQGWQQRPLRELRRHALEAVEKPYLRHVLEQSQGRMGEAAARAGVDVRSLYTLMRKHGLRKEAFRG